MCRPILADKYKFVNGAKSEYIYYTQNAHGDVVNLTNTDGEVTKKYTYDAFGVEKDIDDSDTNAFRYCGEYYDKETATVYLRARYYNPSTGRFISRDTVAGKLEDPLSLNLYNYCANNPILYFDPSGHIKMPKWAKNTWDFIKGTAKEVPYYALDVTMGLSNAIDENLAFGVGNKIRENFGVDAYEPYDQSYYSGVYNVGEAGSAVANAYMLATGVGGLSGSLKNITQAFKGGSKIIAGADGVAVLTSSVSWGNVAEGIIGVVRSGALSGWASGNIVYSKWSGRAKNKLKPDPNATGPHTTYKVDPNTGEITNYVEWEPNPQNPSGFDEAKRYDGTGGSHYNKATGTDVDTPHVHDPKAPGGVRSPYDWEIPK